MSAMLNTSAGWRGIWVGQAICLAVSVLTMYRFLTLTLITLPAAARTKIETIKKDREKAEEEGV